MTGRIGYFRGVNTKQNHWAGKFACAGVLWLLLAAGCGRDTVKVYKADTSDTTLPPPPAATPAAMPATMPEGLAAPDHSGMPALQYTLPAGWKEKPLTQMRVASFDVSENGQTADVSVIPLGGIAGGDLANVNRWRGQVGLPPESDEALQKLAAPVQVGGQTADLYDVAGTVPGSGDAERILGVIAHREDVAWFFKMTGNADLVEKQKPAFLAFLKSVSFGPPAAPAALDMSQLPPAHPSIPGMEPSAVNDASQPTWAIPSDWKPAPLEQFLVAKFIIPGSGDANAAVHVSSLAGAGGGLLPNLNRWRGQLGQPPLGDDDLAKLPTMAAAGQPATVMDVSGVNARTGQPARLVGVVLPLGDQTWFYKLMGDANIVAAQKDAFIRFVQSAKYPAGQ